MTGQVLDGIRVLDLTIGPAGGLATMVLADYGAEVVKVEPPGGDPFRKLSSAPLWLRGKTAIEADLALDAGRAEAHRLAIAADVLVTTMLPGQAASHGLGYPDLAAINPGLIYCRITGFGSEGPYVDYPGYEGIVAAKSGRMQVFAGVPDRAGPAYAAVPVGMHAASQAAVSGILAALLERGRCGRGQLVETSLLQALTLYDLQDLLNSQLGRPFPGSPGGPPVGGGGLPLANHPVPTADDRWLQLGNLFQRFFDCFLMETGLDEIYQEPRYAGTNGEWSEEAREDFRQRMLLHMPAQPAAEWMRRFVANGEVSAALYATSQEAMDDPDMLLNGHVVEVDDPEVGPTRQLGPLAQLSETPAVISARRTAPAGNSRDWIARTPAAPAPAPAAGHAAGGPLAGVTILEFATIIAAPLGAAILADLGARVIKVEPIGGDPFRTMGRDSVMALKTTAGKQSIGVNLKDPEGRAIVESLVRMADGLIHNYRPGVPERLGIGFEQCRLLRPQIVHLAVNGYGPNGPSAIRPATHPIAGAAAGGATMQAAGAHRWHGDTAEELRLIATRLLGSNESNPDPNTSVVAASAMLLGLVAQRRHGAGQQIFVDMLGANAYANALDFIQYEGRSPFPWPDKDLYGLSACYRLYPASEGWIFLALPTDGEFREFARRAGHPELAENPMFATPDARAANDGTLVDSLSGIFAERPADEWEQLLAPFGVGCVRADGPAPGAFWHFDGGAHAARAAVAAVHPRIGEHLRWGPIVDFSATPATPGPGVLGGNSTAAILAELGHSPDEIERLYASGVVWSEA